ncbi:metal-binding protein [[Limnothrix rosea] IAM M-220]|uniref:metal-binding protein n=1 Tax=[Limnothrix rosea] IAM M-220 TaxID=454133 RepID=UPI00095FBDB9|nr:metal-binding protein [[Limnothrix rosea] IAM M-220]OKH13763.1 metal-binding protein [[Limnothrix rosea] IAM M-220]
MPSGRTHDRITLWSLPWVVAIAYVLTRDGELTLIAGLAYLFSGLMFGPDLDIHSVQFKRWGMLRWIWLPYQKTLSHRSNLSHGFLVGTTLRVIYFSIFLLMVGVVGVAIAQGVWGFEWNWRAFFITSSQQVQQHYWAESLALFAGLEIGAMSHSVSDWTSSAIKKFRKKGFTGLLEQKKTKRKSTSRRRKPTSSRKRSRK